MPAFARETSSVHGRLWKGVAAGLAILCMTATAARAEISITAEVDKNSVALNDQVALTVTVTGPAASLPEPKLPELPNFSVYSANTSQSFSFVNGQVSSSNQHTYVLVPHFTGKGTIGPISVTYNGQTSQTQPIEIAVGAAAPSAQPSPSNPAAPHARPSAPLPGEARSPDIFVTAEVDKKKVYVNEQVTLTVKFFTAVNLLGNPQYNAPNTSGFLGEDLPPEHHGTTTMRGRNYYFSEIRTALFPTQGGRLTIGPATVRCQVQETMATDPFAPDFFQRFFQGGGMAQTRDLRSEPLIVDVSALPESGKPGKFSGAVGRFAVSASADRTSAKVGDAVTLTLTVKGAGNLKAIGNPDLPPMPDFRAYDTVAATSLDKKGGRIEGSKAFKTVLVPRVSGDLTIPAIVFDFFDPDARAYRRASTSPIRIKAAPGEAGGGGINFAQSAPAAGAQGLSAVSQDIRYLKPAGSRPALSTALSALASAGWLNLLPFLILAGLAGAEQYERLESLDPRKRRRKAALKNALKRLAEARACAEPKRSAALLSEALSHYLADKLDQPALGLTLKRALELLAGLPEPARERLRSAWQELEALQFAPVSSGTGSGPAASLAELLAELEKEVR